MKSYMPLRALSALALCALVTAGCEGALPNGPAEERAPETGIHPRMVVTSQGADAAEVQLHLVRVGVGDGISSYQGEIAFDSVRATLLDVSFPEAAVGHWRLVDGGRATFAVARPGGLPDSVAATFRFRPAARIEARSVTVRMDEVTAATSDFRDLTAQVVRTN